MINLKYLLNENNTQQMEKLIKDLKDLEERIINNIEMKDGKIIFSNIDVDKELSELKFKLGQNIIELFNVEAFLRKIFQLLDLKQKDVKRNIQLEFQKYIDSLEKRLETIAGEDKTTYDEFYDEWEGEKSVLSRKQFDREKFGLQVELLKLQEWIKKNNKKLAIVFEGRDSAGKGATIKRFTEYLNPKGVDVVVFGVPNAYEKRNWFKRYEKRLPKNGEIVFFDRSWHNRSVVEPAMGYCTEEQYKDFMENVNAWEENLVDTGTILIKFWFSITKEKQIQRFELRMKSPIKYWKFSPNDAKVIGKWDLISYYKKQMFEKNSTTKCPWTIINTNDKKVGILNAIRYVLSTIDYEGKNEEVTKYYPEVVSVVN